MKKKQIMRCSECGGQVIAISHVRFHKNGKTSGEYRCMCCKRVKPYFNINYELIKDMSIYYDSTININWYPQGVNHAYK